MSFLNLFKPLDVEGYKLSAGALVEKINSLDSTQKQQNLEKLRQDSDGLKQEARAISIRAYSVFSAAVLASLTTVGTAVLFKASLTLAAPLALLVLGVGVVAGKFLFKKADSFAKTAILTDAIRNLCEKSSIQSPKPLFALEIKEETFDYKVAANQLFHFSFRDIKTVSYSLDNEETKETIQKDERTGHCIFPRTLQSGERVQFRVQKMDGSWLAHKAFVISVP